MFSNEHQQRLLCLAGLISEGGGGVPRNMSYTSRYNARYRNNKNYPFHKGLKKEQGNYLDSELTQENDLLDEIAPEDVKIPKEFIHDKLNSQIWDGEHLRDDVRKQLIKIANEFYTFLAIKSPIKEIKLIGSMANYNWSSQSDLDLHLFFDFKDISPDIEFVNQYMITKKSLWNEHHNILIKGYPVELYSQDLNEKPHSAAIYDLLNNVWESKPSIENFEIDKASLIVKITSLINCIENLQNSKLDNEEIFKRGSDLKEKLRRMRQSGLEHGGEFSLENLAFKFLRNNGYIKQLIDITKNAYDESMSLKENINEK